MDNAVAQTVQNGATASGQETEKVSETCSAKQRREERMMKFDIECETMMWLEQGRFERRKLELEMQMKEPKTKHQLLEEERELERKVKRTALENDDVSSQLTSARDYSLFYWTPKKRDVSDWASRIDNLLIPDRSTAPFEITPEVNRRSHLLGYRSSRDRSSGVEDRDVSLRAGLRYKQAIQIAVTYQSWGRTTSSETSPSGRSGLVCSLLQWINAQYLTQRRWAIWRLYWQARQGQQSLEWDILDSSMVLHGAFWRGILEGFMWSLMHNWRVFAKQVSWNLTTQQV